MKGWAMYSKVQQLKENGLKKSQVIRNLKIDFKTTKKYWDMSPEEYSSTANKSEGTNWTNIR